ncbi:Uronate isomerase [Planctomycetes bacterium CA13]|uniref:Uronate isomerase n=1 Tax=Novipirellula herctigrandis TaxID=2527986 RepID=A0A5C5Z7F3_9BACT|nr:Uronate isomerase [Planctomycetes bacterium CA13]
MPHPTRDTIYQAISAVELIDPHTHINPHAPASRTLADLLGYHYYTELAHSAGMPKDQMEEPDIAPKELVRRLVENLHPIENTSQYQWLVAICQKFFGFESDRLDTSNWETLYDKAEQAMSAADWSQTVLEKSNVRSVFLTNDFDDELTGFDTETYIPCLRTDDLVFKFHQRETRERLERSSGVSLSASLSSLREALRQRFEHFTSNGARACAISLPPTFEPAMVTEGRAINSLDAMLQKSESADETQKNAFSRSVFWMLAELCDEFDLPFDLMIGVNRGVYANGVYQGQDLYDSRVSLIQYRELFNTFADVKFPISVLASVTNQELVSYAWIFPNVFTSGHWWYSNTPSFIHRDASARLEAVPMTKQIGYYSDAYKLEFVWPKFDMYRQILASILAEHFVGMNGWSEEKAIELGYRILRGNVEEIFLKRPMTPMPALEAFVTSPKGDVDDLGAIESQEVVEDPSSWQGAAAAATSAALTAGAIGVVEVDEQLSEMPEVELPEGELPELEVPELEVPELEVPEAEVLQLEASELEASEFVSEAEEDDTELDPLPHEDEVKLVEVADVELADDSPQASPPDADTIDMEADREPLHVGDLLGEEETPELENRVLENAELETKELQTSELETIEIEATDPDLMEFETTGHESIEPLEMEPGQEEGELASEETEIEMFRGETSFEPDEDSLKLRPDPLTGELRLPMPAESNDVPDLLDELGLGFFVDEPDALDESDESDEADASDEFGDSGEK